MSNVLSLPSSLVISAPAGKNGTVSKQTKKAAHLLHLNRDALMASALYGKGTLGKVARATVGRVVRSLDDMLQSHQIDGGDWGTLYTLQVAEFGLKNHNATTHTGKSGVLEYAAMTVRDAVQSFARAEAGSAQKDAMGKIERAEYVNAQVNRLFAVAEEAKRVALESAETATEATTTEASEAQAAEAATDAESLELAEEAEALGFFD